MMVKYASIGSSKMPVSKTILFSTAYLAPVEYYMLLAQPEQVLIEGAEHYQKQTYRNRCHIATANGSMALSIPVDRASNALIRDVRISNHSDWQTQHWRSIESAYNSSPFFEYYADDLKPFYQKKWLFLWDFNTSLQNKLLELLQIEKQIEFSDKFELITDDSVWDVRNSLQPKKDSMLTVQPYYQVFEQKWGFIPQLSIIDLLFNMGNESQLVLSAPCQFRDITNQRIY